MSKEICQTAKIARTMLLCNTRRPSENLSSEGRNYDRWKLKCSRIKNVDDNKNLEPFSFHPSITK